MGRGWASKGNAWQASIPSGRTAMAAVGVQLQPKGLEPFLLGVREVGVGSDRATDAPGSSGGRSDSLTGGALGAR